MRKVVILGKPDTKRTHYLGRAAREAGLHALFLDWDQWQEHFPEGRVFLKIEPPVWDSFRLEQLGSLVEAYKGQLRQLEERAQRQDVVFWNHPRAIEALLDKRECKGKLEKAGVAVTEELDASLSKDRLSKDGWSGTGRIETAEQLLERMRQRRMYQVFIKPVFGSGAAGVAAFRWQPRTGRMVLYTCMWETAFEGKEKGLVNTKQLRRFTDSGQVISLVEKLLKLGCVVERWYAKEEYQGFSYDLRAVVQDGHMDFCLARLSQGPITNLHLNNHPLDLAALGLPETVREKVEKLCRCAMGCFEGLRSAGVDILLEKGSQIPRVIEMNAQGDLIYQDIYGDNRIYRRQAELMKAACVASCQ